MKRHPPLTSRGTRLFACAAALLLSILIGFMHRAALNTFWDYALIAGISFGFMSWTVLCLRINKNIQPLSLVARAFAFALTMFVLVLAGVLIRRHVTGELASQLANARLHLFALLPLLPGFLAQPLLAEVESEPTSR